MIRATVFDPCDYLEHPASTTGSLYVQVTTCPGVNSTSFYQSTAAQLSCNRYLIIGDLNHVANSQNVINDLLIIHKSTIF